MRAPSSRQRTVSIVCIVLLAVALTVPVAEAIVVGAPPELSARFAEAEKTGFFQCLDGSKTIPFSAVNDDYCDCTDGSDEPGTSACVGLGVNGVVRTIDGKSTGFLCENVGSKPEYIPLSKVADGICDCCDGSDEFSTASCPNVCATVAKEREAKAKAEAAMLAKATTARAAMRKSAEKYRATKAGKVDALLKQVQHLEGSLADLEAAVRKMEEENEAKKQEMDAAPALGESEHSSTTESDNEALCVAWHQTGKCRPDGPAEPGKDKDCDAVIPSTDSGFCECILSDATISGEETENTHYGFACKHEPLTCAYVCTHGGKPGLPGAVPADGSTLAPPELSTQRNHAAQVSKELEAARSELKEIQTLLARPIGTEDLLRTMTGESFTLDHQDYTYELILFDNTVQHNKGKRGGPSLGKWHSFAESTYSSWSKDAFDLSQMRYRDGTSCWNGVIRSTDVHVVCGATNRLALIEEPSMCTYSMVFETPAMCEE